MGVRRLQTYVQREVPDGYVKINMVNEINNWKRYDTNEI